MKLKKFKKFKNSFYNLTFIKIKYYLVNILIKNDLNLNSFKSINLKLKILLKVLFEFHKLDKNIVFIGFHNQSNYYNFSVLFKKFNYKILNKNVWINGILCNSKNIYFYLNSKRIHHYLEKKNIYFLKKFINSILVQKVPDLIVLYDLSDNKKLLSEALKLNIPIFAFLGNESFNTNSSIFYIFNSNIGNISKKKVSSYIYFLISAILIRVLKKSFN